MIKNKISNLGKIALVLLILAVLPLFFVGSRYEKTPVLNEGAKFIAHRGLSSVYYQNSFAAFEGAGKSDFFYGIETDIWRTADGIWVCAHDINPFAEKNKKINEITYAEALTLALDLEKAGNAEVSGTTYLCDFETYLGVCISYGKIPVIEIKYSAAKEELSKLVSYLSGRIRLEDIIFISFREEVIARLMEINASLNLQKLTKKVLAAYRHALTDYNIGISSEIFSKTLLEKAHNKGNIINVWTVNDRILANYYKESGVDFITTDFDFSF